MEQESRLANADGAPADHRSPDDDLLATQVRDALTHLHDPTRLQTHPLGRRLGLVKGGGGSGLARTLQRRLLEAIEAVHPDRGVSADSHAWRGYQLLRLRYVEALAAATVQERLAISKSEYHRDHRQAILAIASFLSDSVAERVAEVAPEAYPNEPPSSATH